MARKVDADGGLERKKDLIGLPRKSGRRKVMNPANEKKAARAHRSVETTHACTYFLLSILIIDLILLNFISCKF
jgi:hypothetical protein